MHSVPACSGLILLKWYCSAMDPRAPAYLLRSGRLITRAAGRVKGVNVTPYQCLFLLHRPLFELGFPFTGCGKVCAALKSQQSDGSILFRGMARSAALVVSQALFQIDRAPNVDAACQRRDEMDLLPAE